MRRYAIYRLFFLELLNKAFEIEVRLYTKKNGDYPIAGWPPHTSVENILEIIRNILSVGTQASQIIAVLNAIICCLALD